MAILKCKMCGGNLEIEGGASTCTCDFCGTQQTIPTVKEEALQGLFNRANVLRMKSEFDKAGEIYEKIIQQSESEAEAYWGLILCKYGIEYVEDPKTFKRIPTCHRASYDAVVSDEDYKKALEYADSIQKGIYEAEAITIDEIQKGIIALAQKEDPYDVFICYKETDDAGKRTQDSVIANDIYHQLVQEGYKVFYAAISLEDKLGKEYEPYIFSALNTAKVMLSIGTKPEYFNAVWVKNEWSRFLKIMKKDRSKLLIPCYRDMDPYELPEEFAHLQAQDMGKIGFINDIVRGIQKVLGKSGDNDSEIKTVQSQQSSGNTTTTAQVQRGNMALEDGEWQKADNFFEEALNINPQCAEAYLGKLLAKYKQSNISSFSQLFISKYENANLEKLEAFPEDTSHIEQAILKYAIQGYLSADKIKVQYEFDRNYMSELSSRKDQKNQVMSELENEKLLIRARQYANEETKGLIDKIFSDVSSGLDIKISDAQKRDDESIANLKSSYEERLNNVDTKVQELNKYSLERQENHYQSLVSQMNTSKTIDHYAHVMRLLKQMNGYKDTNALADKCQAEIDRIKENERLETERLWAARRKEEERQAKKRKKITTIVTAVTVAVIVIYMVVAKVVIPIFNYNKAVELVDSKQYEDAMDILLKLDGYPFDDKLKATAEINIMAEASVGDHVSFGNYKGNTEWVVLDKQDGKIFVVSKYEIEQRPYNTEYESITWEKCTLRSWLNGTYLSSAFSSDEQARIIEASIENKNNTEYGIDGGNNTTDKVFLLSIDEVNKYFTSDSAREATLADGTSVWWWLRSPGNDSRNAAAVYSNGSVFGCGYSVLSESIAVRPALWIDISDL